MTEAIDYTELFSIEPFSLNREEKRQLHAKYLSALQEHHVCLCPQYARMVEAFGDAPALPVRLFKEYELRSMDAEDAVKTMTSSGTTSQRKSRIFLDRETSARQTKALSRIVGAFTGEKKRMPMLVIDAEGTVKDRSMFSARTAGIRGFSMFGRDVTFALHDDMTLDWEAVERFAAAHANERILAFGFTFMVWASFVEEARKRALSVDLDGILVHGGGWKKLADRAVSHDEFAAGVKEVLGAGMRSCDYYGMVEQTGSISMECECGHLHVSEFSDIDVVDPASMSSQPMGERGLIVTTSLLPTSYPGHILLTEDEGAVLGEDDCPCGRKGRYFEVYGRQRGAEIRGCSDTYAG